MIGEFSNNLEVPTKHSAEPVNTSGKGTPAFDQHGSSAECSPNGCIGQRLPSHPHSHSVSTQSFILDLLLNFSCVSMLLLPIL